MLAVVKSRPGPGVEIMERPEPSISRDDFVLVEVAACGVCGTDVHFYEWSTSIADEITLPRILGHEVAGTVLETGKAVTQFKPGDRVVADTWGGCGRCYYCRLGRFNHCLHQTRLGQKADGGMARHVVVPEVSLFGIPAEMPMDEAAVIEPVGVALRCFERVQVRPGDSVAVIGPGPIGLLAAMMAEQAGAHQVIVLGLSADGGRLNMARQRGYDTVASDRGDAVQVVRELTGGLGVETVIEASGAPTALGLAVELARLGGQVGLIGLPPSATFNATGVVVRELTIFGSWRRVPSTWHRAINLVATRKIDVRPLITHRFSVAEARDAFEVLLRREGVKVLITPEEQERRSV